MAAPLARRETAQVVRCAKLALFPVALTALLAVTACDRTDDGDTTPDIDIDTDCDERTPPPGTPANPGGSTP